MFLKKLKNGTNMIKLIINLTFCFISIFIFLLSPSSYSYEYNFFILLIFIIINVFLYFFEIRGKGIGFELIFMISFMMVNLIYPVFYYESNPYFSLFAYSFPENVISKSSAIALVAYSFYVLGITSYKNIDYSLKKIVVSDSYIKINLFFVVFLYLLFFLTGGLQIFANIYAGNQYSESSIAWYILVFMNILLYMLCSVILISKKNIIKFLSLFIILIVMISFLLTGARLLAISLAVILLASYSFNVKKISILNSLLTIFIGSNILFFILKFREDGMSFSRLGVIYDDFKDRGSFFDPFTDLIINNRNLYILVDYVDVNGFTYFKNILFSLFTIIPGSSFLIELFSVPENLRGNLTTYLTLGGAGDFGFGTNMVGEAYLSLGILGVILVFYIFGLCIKYFKNNRNNSIYEYTVYMYLISQAVFYPRIDYLWGIRSILWMLILIVLISFISKKLSN